MRYLRVIKTLTGGDLKNVQRDPILVLLFFVPFSVVALFRFAIPFATQLLDQHLAFDLTPHYAFIISMVSLIVPMTYGFVMGFILLEERDENILNYFAVTPLTKGGYLWYKMIIPMVVSTFFSLMILLLLPFTDFPVFKIVLLCMVASMEAPLMALFLAAFAQNKVEGMAVGKLGSIIFMAPFIGYFAPGIGKLGGALFPPWWISMTFLVRYSDSFWLYLVGAIVVHLVFLYILLKKYLQRIE
ncbi:MAG: hypothetical protein MJB14_18865 [Spirochaetes bacterium]|nr:hypothetical protein [Spirochaetota bacterium]